MRNLLESWESFQNEIVATTETASEPNTVLGVKIKDVPPDRLNSYFAKQAIARFKKIMRRFANQGHKFLLFQNNFLQLLLTYPVKTMTLESVDSNGTTTLNFSGEFGEDMRVYKNLGDVRKLKKSFTAVLRENKVRKNVIAFCILLLVSLIFLSVTIWGIYHHYMSGIVLPILLFGIFSLATFAQSSVFDDIKNLRIDYRRAMAYDHLTDHGVQQSALFTNESDLDHCSLDGIAASIQCEFNDFSTLSTNVPLKKRIIIEAQELADAMGGRLFFLIAGNDSARRFYFYPKYPIGTEYKFCFYIAEVGIRLKEATLFMKEWPGSIIAAKELEYDHVQMVFGKYGIDMFIDSNPF